MFDAKEKEVRMRKKKQSFDWYRKIIECLIVGLKRSWSNEQIAKRLNEINFKTAAGRLWNENLVHEKFNVLVYRKKSHFTAAYESMISLGLVGEDEQNLLMTKMRK